MTAGLGFPVLGRRGTAPWPSGLEERPAAAAADRGWRGVAAWAPRAADDNRREGPTGSSVNKWCERAAAPLPAVAGAVRCIEPRLFMPSPPNLACGGAEVLGFIFVWKLPIMAGVPFSFVTC